MGRFTSALGGLTAAAWLSAGPAHAEVIEIAGTIGLIERNEIGLPIDQGDAIAVTICYDETTPEASVTESDPQAGLFPDAILGSRIEIPAAGFDVPFTPVVTGTINMSDNFGGSPVFADVIGFQSDGGTDPIPPVADPVRIFTVSVTDSVFAPGTPDLVVDANTLPGPELDLSSPGILVVTFAMTTLSSAAVAGQITNPTATAGDSIKCPEPGAVAQGLAVCAALLLLGATRRTRSGSLASLARGGARIEGG